MGKLIMLNANSTLPRAMRLSDLINKPISQVIDYLANQPDYMGEAIAKMAYQQIARENQHS